MKQVYFSEDLGKTFETEEECLAAEKEHNEKVEAEKAKKAERKQRAEEVEAAFKDADEAYKHAKEVLNAFIKDYGSWHYSRSSTLPATKSLFDLFFSDNFFNLF